MNETPFLHLMELEIENTLCTRVSEKMRQHPTVDAGHCVFYKPLKVMDPVELFSIRIMSEPTQPSRRIDTNRNILVAIKGCNRNHHRCITCLD